MSIVTVTPPTIEPVSLKEAKDQVRVVDSSEDLFIDALITAAREWCEDWQGRAYITQTLKLVLDEFPSGQGEILLPRPPLQSIESITYIDGDGAQQTLDAADYYADTASTPGRLRPPYGTSWPSARKQMAAVEITFKAGYGDTAKTVPGKIRQAVKLRFADLFEHREPTVIGTISTPIASVAAESILWQDRVVIE